MAASYEARRYKVHSALPLAIAHRRCPQAVLLRSDIAHYRRQSRRVIEVLRRYSDVVEVVGLDEAYLDLSGSRAPKARARQLKAEVREETGLVCSIGLGPNKLVAKIASDLEKPDGFCALTPEAMLEAVGDRPASLIPGVGPKTYERLQRHGLRTVAELAAAPSDLLERALGPRLGPQVHERARGIDDRRLDAARERKSESRETTFAADVTDRALLHSTITRLARSTCEGLAAEGLAGRTVTLKLRLAPFRTHTRSRTLESPTSEPGRVARVASELLERFDPDLPIRLIGVGVSALERESGGAPEGAAAPQTLSLLAAPGREAGGAAPG
jgi:nucleotidyltransferase/DNA polymerase involved in DNA repair